MKASNCQPWFQVHKNEALDHNIKRKRKKGAAVECITEINLQNRSKIDVEQGVWIVDSSMKKESGCREPDKANPKFLLYSSLVVSSPGRHALGSTP